MKIDDITFCNFVFNALPQSEMSDVEKQLIEDEEAFVTVLASLAVYESSIEHANKMLGVDLEEIDNEISQHDRNTNFDISIDEKVKQINNQNCVTMNTQLTEEEVRKIQNLVEGFNASFNIESTLDENLKNFYMEQRPGIDPDKAEEVVTGLHAGVEIFNTKLMKALSEEDFDYANELNNLVIDKPLKEQYELYLNFLAALTTLNMNNIKKEQLTEIENYETIREHLEPIGEVTEDMLNEVKQQIAEELNNNTFCLGNIDALRQIVTSLPDGTESIVTAVRGSEEDVRQKLISAMALYVAYENGNIESLNETELTPEMAGISASAGIEQTNVINDLASGKTTADKAIRILKIIGGVALLSMLFALSLAWISLMAVLPFSVFVYFFGLSKFVAIISIIVGVYNAKWYAEKLYNDAKPHLTPSSRVFGPVVELWTETMWPGIKKAYTNTVEWLKNLFSFNKVRVSSGIPVDTTTLVS